MPRNRTLGLSLLAALQLAALPGCGSEAEPAEPPASPSPVDATDPLAEIPLEELYGADPASSLWTPRVELEPAGLPPGWAGVRLAVISDLQLGRWPGNEQVAAAAVRRAIEADPEIVVLLGDFLAEGTDTAPLQRVLAPLRNRTTLAVLGDGDAPSDSIAARVASALEGSGVRVLRNSATSIVIDGDTAWIAGTDPEMFTMTAAEQAYILATLGVPGRTPVLLTTAPILAARAPDNRYPIVIAGDTFCGDVDVPGSTRLVRLRETILSGAAVEEIDRLFQIEGTTLLIACGVGYGFVPLRFGAPPEVLLLTLGGPQATVPADTTATAVPDSLLELFQGEQPADSL
jgi:uncharacterized protein